MPNDDLRVMYLVRIEHAWHYVGALNASRSYCGVAFGRDFEWWRFGDWADRRLCGNCQRRLSPMKVLIVAR